ncbi:MAG: helix-turn-helix domain-containing protein, partial [Streptosporangiaceae bacterium]
MDTLEPEATGRNLVDGVGPVSGVGVLDRSMLLLGLLGDGPRTLRSLAEASALPRPTAHRLLVALEVHGLV